MTKLLLPASIDALKKNGPLQKFSVGLLLCVAGYCLYTPALGGDFQMDDVPNIVENASIKHLDPRPILGRGDLRFLTNYSFALNYHFSGLNVKPYRAVNVLIHCVNAFLLFLFLNLLLARQKDPIPLGKTAVATTSALIFLVHPVQTQAVNFIVQRAALLSTFFCFLTFICYVHFRAKGLIRYYVAAVLSAFASVHAKPISISLPIILVLMEFIFFERDRRIKWFLFVPFVLFALYQFDNLVSYVELLAGEIRQEVSTWRFQYLFTQFRVWVTYLRLLLLPIHQNFDYDYPVFTVFLQRDVWLSLLFLAGAFLAALLVFWRRKIIVFGILFFTVCLLPESSVYPITDVIFEHRLYLPLAGFAIALAVGISLFCRRNVIYWLVMGAIIFSLSILTYHRNILWGDGLRLMEDTVQKSPRKARVRNNLGIFYGQRGNQERAEEQFKLAAGYDPLYFPAHLNLADIYFSKKDYEQAVEYSKKALHAFPYSPTAYVYLGHVAFEKGNLDEAAQNYRKAVEIEPLTPAALNGLANVSLRKGDLNEAFRLVRRAKFVNPDSAISYYLEGNVYFVWDQLDAAVRAYRKATQLEPGFLPAHNNLGGVFFKLGRFEDAEACFQQVLKLEPTLAGAYLNLANVYNALGQTEKAREHLSQAKRLAEEQSNQRLLHKIDDLAGALK